MSKDTKPLGKTIEIESLEDLKKIPLGMPILNVESKYKLVYDNNYILFDTLEEQNDFIGEVSVDSAISRKKAMF